MHASCSWSGLCNEKGHNNLENWNHNFSVNTGFQIFRLLTMTQSWNNYSMVSLLQTHIQSKNLMQSLVREQSYLK